MKHLVIAAVVALGVSDGAWALCKYRDAEGTWTYAKTCREKPEKEIGESAALVLKRNREQLKHDDGVRGRRLRGFEYSDSTHSGMRIRLAEPNKAPSGQDFTSR